MRFSSFVAIRPETVFVTVAACILNSVLLHCTGLYARAEPLSATEQQVERKEVPGQNSAKRLSKYNVDHIGQRGIGRGLDLYSLSRERTLGQNLAASLEHNTKFINDELITEYINKLGQMLVRNSDAEVPFTIKVIDSSGMHAFSLPGGFLYVDKGLITGVDEEAELVSIMAHEIGHVAARHATRALTRKRLADLVSTVGLFTGPIGPAVEDVTGMAGPLSLKKFSRDAEYEADLLGVEYIYTAGYDPQAFVSALEKVDRNEVKMQEMFSKIPGYHLFTKIPFHKQIARSVSSYPLTEERIHQIEAEISTFLPPRRDYVVDTSEFREIKSKLLASEAPVLLRHRAGAEGGKGPILHRNRQ
jgi:predicted Zn-dependent protease